jgi:Acetyl xylan esterase (AXE1)
MRKYIITVCISLTVILFNSCSSSTGGDRFALQNQKTDSLPDVMTENRSDLIAVKLKHEASLRFSEHQLPATLKEWEVYRVQLRNEVISKAGVVINHSLPVNIKETARIRMKGYTIRNIAFQTRPGVYATANLFMPDGPGPFPAVVNMLGHWRKGKIDSTGPQAVGHTLALNGYVCLTIDPWGAGERTTKHGDFEYHGGNLGASLMNIGEPLIGMQISDNIRGVDLLCTLPEVDTSRIGATGASGGGNQTMWFSAIDERVKAAVPVVSVGTFESYIMQSNCICELLPDGLTFTEEAGIVALSRAILLINHNQDSNPTFFPSEMLRTYRNARPVFKMKGNENNIAYRLFDLPHGYMAEDRSAMLGWFDLHLKGKGTGEPKKEIPFEQLPERKLLVYPDGERDPDIVTTEEYCRIRGKELRSNYLNTGSFDVELKRRELRAILRIDETVTMKKVCQYSPAGIWNRLALETSDKMLIPMLLLPPENPSLGYVIICNPGGKRKIPVSLIDKLKNSGRGIVITDLEGTGELTSTSSIPYDYNGKLHTLSRAELWLGRSVMGDWVKELDLVTGFLYSGYEAKKISIDGTGEEGLAGLFLAALGRKVESITLRDSPVSYLFDSRDSVDYYGMGIHLPGFLKWGDVSLAAALIGGDVIFINPMTMSGMSIDKKGLDDIRVEFDNAATRCGSKGKISLVKL